MWRSEHEAPRYDLPFTGSYRENGVPLAHVSPANQLCLATVVGKISGDVARRIPMPLCNLLAVPIVPAWPVTDGCRTGILIK